MKSSLYFLLGVCCFFNSLADIPYGEQHDETINGVHWVFQITDEGTALIGGRSDYGSAHAVSYDTAGDVVIPDLFRGYPPVYIGWSAFSSCKKITSIWMPDSITEITTTAFSSCQRLSNIKWSAGLRAIGSAAFAECASLTAVHLPTGVVDIGQQAFRGCSSLSTVEIPYSVVNIRGGAFVECKRLTDVRLSEGLKAICFNAFGCCYELREVEIPASVELIEGGAFCGSTNLVSLGISPQNPYYTLLGGALYNKQVTKFVTCPSSFKHLNVEPGVVCIVGRACYRCYSLQSINLPESLTEIESEAFKYCRELPFVIIPPKVKTIGSHAFYGCASLRSVVVPKSVESVGSEAFQSCSVEVVFVEEGDTERVKGILRNSMIGVDRTQFVELPVSATAISWSDDYYRKFSERYDPDIQTAMKMPSGKRTATGEEMFVWEDFVAGSDPLDASSKFEAVISLVDGIPVVSWTPELKPEQAALRKYTVYGKAHLYDEKWSVVDGDTEKYSFFNVTVEMR